MANADQLRQLMSEHHMTRPRTAELAGVQKTTVDSWLYPEGSRHHRNMPDRALDLIRLRLAQEKTRSVNG